MSLSGIMGRSAGPESALLNVMTRAAAAAARVLARDFGEVAALQVSRKGPADFVSAADLRAEEILREALHRARPDYLLVLEEAGGRLPKGDERAWVVDPLDGTTNFLHGVPWFAVSIAAVEGDRILAAVIHNPVSGEVFIAERGAGAWSEGRRLRVASRAAPPDLLLGTGFPFHGLPGHERALAGLARLMPQVAGVRRFGAAALDLALVASGRLDGFWQRDLKPWDWAAGALLVEEAGGFATDAEGRSLRLGSPSVVAANESVHGWLRRNLAHAEAAMAAPGG